MDPTTVESTDKVGFKFVTRVLLCLSFEMIHGNEFAVSNSLPSTPYNTTELVHRSLGILKLGHNEHDQVFLSFLFAPEQKIGENFKILQ